MQDTKLRDQKLGNTGEGNMSAINSRLLLIVVLLSALLLGQVAYAQDSGDCGDSVS
jgi:hypothetical protein